MTDLEIQLLKNSIEKTVEIETVDGEHLVAKVLSVAHDEEYDEHDVVYEMISSSTPEFYASHPDSGGFLLDFGKILSVRPYSELGTKAKG